MPRPQSPLLLVAVLGIGMILGIELNRGLQPVRAQVGQLPYQATAHRDDRVKLATSSPGKPATEDGVYRQLADQYDRFEPINRTFELVARAVSPSVVHLVTHKAGRVGEGDPPYTSEETGSGVIVRGEATPGLFVLTNNHVVANAALAAINIVLSDGRSFHPTRVWSDSKADVAVLRLDRTDLPAARLGNSDDAAVGSWVMAMGSPFGLTHSVSQGIISGRGRHEVDLERAGVENQDFLQTDAAINPGNSGGPLVNMKGEVVGINIAILSNGGGNEGVGFSIPINVARWIMGQLLANGRVNRGALGIKLQPAFAADSAAALGLDHPRGAWIESVEDQSPASVGGVRVGDVILRFNGVEVIDLNHLINLVSMAPIGQKADVVVWRDRHEMQFNVLVADKDRITGPVARTPRPPAPTGTRRSDPNNPASRTMAGLDFETLDGTSTHRMGLPDHLRGVVITRIDPTSQWITYFQPLDIVYSIAGRPVSTVDDLATALGGNWSSNEFWIHRFHDGSFQRFKVRVPR